MKKKLWLRTAQLSKTILLTSAVLLSCAGGIGAEETAAASSGSSAGTEVQTAEEEKAELKPLGKADEGSMIVHVNLENATGQNITQLSVLDDMTDLPIEKWIEEGDVFAQGEKRVLYYDTEPAESEAKRRNEEAPEGAVAVTPAYTLRITLADGQTYDLHGFTFTDMKEGRIELADQVAYLVYKSVKTGQEVVTKEAELAVKAQKEAAQSSMQEAYQEPVYEEPVYQEPVYQEPVYEEPVYEEPAPVYEEPVIDAGGADQCITDGLTY